MSSPIAARRLELHDAARSDPAAFLRLDPARLRFSLGTSLADRVVPVEVAADARAILQAAAAEVTLLLATHHRAFVPADDLDRLLLREDYGTLPDVAATLGPGAGASAAGPDLRGAAQVAPAVHPALTGGLVLGWMGRGGKGRSLVALWIELLRRAFEESRAGRGAAGAEETPLLVALALAAESARAEAVVRPVLPAPPVDRYLRSAALLALWVAARTGLARAWRDAGLPAEDPLLARLEAALSPAGLVGGRQAFLAGGATIYGCELSAGVPRADDLVGRLSGGLAAADARAEVEAALGLEPELARRAEQAVAVARFRDLLGAGIDTMEVAGHAEAAAPLRVLYSAPGALAAALAEPEARKALARQLAETSPGADPRAHLDRAASIARGWSAKEPAAALGLSPGEARADYAESASALLADLALEKAGVAARRVLSFRTGREAEGGADFEWEAGRLYRLSARGGAIRSEAEDRPTGHLFADVKDFTRRTSLLGQASMAEFLRKEFYLPILVAAKEHFGGMQHLADRGGVVLNNLLGDAVSFTGRIDAMVSLARGIRAQFAAYSMRLAREVSSDVVSKQLAAIEEDHGRRLAAAREESAAAAAAHQALAGEPAGSPRRGVAAARAERARAEEGRILAERDRAVSRARGEGLEAGTFISFGPAPLVVAIEDEVFGRNRVAIADKINESARGTARAPAARARADAALARERLRSGNAALVHAWSVFIGQPMPLSVPAEAEEQAVRLWRAGDLQGAMRALAVPVRDGLEAAAREAGERPGDIYNSGAALSEEALEAFLAEVAAGGGAGAGAAGRDLRRVTVMPEEIPAALRARWYFGDAPQTFVACFHPGRGDRVIELFRRVGRASFKGLGGVVVWELCAEDGAPAALAQALGTGWFRAGPAVERAAEGR